MPCKESGLTCHLCIIRQTNQAVDRLQAFSTLYKSEAGLDLDVEIDALVSDLQVIYEEAE